MISEAARIGKDVTVLGAAGGAVGMGWRKGGVLMRGSVEMTWRGEFLGEALGKENISECDGQGMESLPQRCRQWSAESAMSFLL